MIFLRNRRKKKNHKTKKLQVLNIRGLFRPVIYFFFLFEINLSLSRPKEKTKTKQKERLQRFTSQMWYSESLKGQLCARPRRGHRRLPASPWPLRWDKILPGGPLQDLLPLQWGGGVPTAPFGARLAQSFFLAPLPGGRRWWRSWKSPGGRRPCVVVIATQWKGRGCSEVSIRKWRGPCLWQW